MSEWHFQIDHDHEILLKFNVRNTSVLPFDAK